MNRIRFIHVAAACALTGGVLRAVDAFTVGVLTDAVLKVLYIGNDLLLAVALAGIYARHGASLRWPGLLGLLMALSAIVWIRLVARGPAGYFQGAALFSAGMAVIGGAMLRYRLSPAPAPVCWLLSFFLGALGLLLPGQTVSFLVASLLFSAGFIVLGVQLPKAGQAGAQPGARVA